MDNDGDLSSGCSSNAKGEVKKSMSLSIAQNDFCVVLGLGKTGESIIEYLDRKKIKVCGMDSRISPPCIKRLKKSFNDVFYSLGKIDHDLLEKCSLIITSPGFEYGNIKKKYGEKLISDIELFSSEVKAPVIAVTGTNGKSTVSALIKLVLESAGFNVALGGNFGRPALDLLKEKTLDYLILELSSFQLENTYSLRPFIGVITNISADHLDRHLSFFRYKQIKEKLFEWSTNIVVCRDEQWSSKYCEAETAKTFSINKPSEIGFGIIEKCNKKYFGFEDTLLFSVEDIKIFGKHNWLNVLAVLAAVSNCTKLDAGMFGEIKKFKGLPHRSEFVSKIKGITFINDSKATNVGAAIAAMNSFFSNRKGVLIAGGLFKGGNICQFATAIEQFCHSVVLIGSCTEKIESTLSDSVFCKVASSLRGAVQEAAFLAKAGDTVLLSPASSSLDMFRNYEHRGDVFKQAVSQWGQNG